MLNVLETFIGKKKSIVLISGSIPEESNAFC